MWKAIGKTLASIGLPLLGTAVGGPAGGMVGKGIAVALGLSGDSPDELTEKLKNIDPATYAMLKQYEMDNATELAKMATSYDTLQLQGQIDLAKGDQTSGSPYRAGWRPTVGWVCVFGLAYTFAFRPLLPWFVDVFSDVGTVVPTLPAIDTSELIVLLLGMLGLGGARTLEKVKGLD